MELQTLTWSRLDRRQKPFKMSGLVPDQLKSTVIDRSDSVFINYTGRANFDMCGVWRSETPGEQWAWGVHFIICQSDSFIIYIIVYNRLSGYFLDRLWCTD